MIKKKRIGKGGYSRSSNCEIPDDRWISLQSTKSNAATLTDNLFFLSIHDLSDKTRCTVLTNFNLRSAILHSNPLSGFFSLSPFKKVSTFAATSGKLAGANLKV